MTPVGQTKREALAMAEIASDVKQIRALLEGEDGLIASVRRNTNYRIASNARAAIIKWAVGSGWLMTLIVAVYATTH